MQYGTTTRTRNPAITKNPSSPFGGGSRGAPCAISRARQITTPIKSATTTKLRPTNDSAVQALGDENLRFIAQELTKTIHENVTIDWTEREAVRAKLRVLVKRILRKYGYPPDKQEQATKTVLEQAELLCAEWA
jgi:hypothetical protein